MNLEVVNKGEFSVLVVRPGRPEGWLLAVHGYGGCKEEMLGIVLSLARKGFFCVVPDLPGHGESRDLFNHANALRCLDLCGDFIPGNYTAVLGHSIGARLILEQTRNVRKIAVSPPSDTSFPGGKKEMHRVLRPRRVKEAVPFGGLKEVLEAMGPALPQQAETRSLLLFAQYDLPTVKLSVQNASKDIYDVVEIRYSKHHDILTSRDTAAEIWTWLSIKS